MREAKRIYCIEGVHNWDKAHEEPSANSMIAQVKNLGSEYWKYHTLRSCATLQELEYRLKYEWPKSCSKGSVLYFNTHGSPGLITLAEEDGYRQVIGLDTLKHWVDCTGCHVHFGGCAIFGCDPKILYSFLEQTNASSISGYAADDINWLDPEKPGLVCESILFDLLGRVSFENKREKLADDMYYDIQQKLNGRFADCEFLMLPVIKANYYVNKKPRSNGVHEVHKERCKRLSRNSTNREMLGKFYGYQPAVNAAEQKYSKARGCQSCCPI